MSNYIILGFATGCKPCTQLKDLMSELVIPYQFVDGKLANNPTGLVLKRLVKESTLDSVVPALFIRDGSTYLLVATGIEDCANYVKEHYNND